MYSSLFLGQELTIDESRNNCDYDGQSYGADSQTETDLGLL